jgi:hypothetical protein
MRQCAAVRKWNQDKEKLAVIDVVNVVRKSLKVHAKK